MKLTTMLPALLLGVATAYDYENLEGRFTAELRYVMGAGQGLREGQTEVTHVSLALLGADGKRTQVIDSEGETDRPYRFNEGRLPGFEIAKQLEARNLLKDHLGLEGPTYKLFLAGLPFPFGPTDKIPFMGNQELDLGMHVSLYNQPSNAQYGAEYTPPTEADVQALAARIGTVEIRTKDFVIINGSELNDMKAGGCYYLGLSVATIDGVNGADYARMCQESMRIPQADTQRFHITCAAVGPSWRSHPKAGRLETPGDLSSKLISDENIPKKWGMPMCKPCPENAGRFAMNLVVAFGNNLAAPTCGPDYTLFRRGTNVHTTDDAPVVEFAGWDNNEITGWTDYCEGATTKTNANNVLKNAWVGATKAFKAAQDKFTALRDTPRVRTGAEDDTADAALRDQAEAERTSALAEAELDMTTKMAAAEAARQASVERNQDILETQGFPNAVGQSEERKSLVTPANQEELLVALQEVGDIQKLLKIE